MRKQFTCVVAVLLVFFGFKLGERVFLVRDYTVSFVNVGQGDSCLVRTPDGLNVLIDGGDHKGSGNAAISEYCRANNIWRIDVAFVSHYHGDHINGMIDLLNNIPCGILMMPPAITDDEYKQRDRLINTVGCEKAYYFEPGESVEMGENLDVEQIFFNDVATTDANDHTAILRLDCFDTSILYTGDIDTKLEAEIIAALDSDEVKCDIIKVAHHGSKYSSSDEFYEVADPEIAVISVGRNSYGHPTTEAIERIIKSGAQVLRTDELGTVNIKIDSQGYY